MHLRDSVQTAHIATVRIRAIGCTRWAGGDRNLGRYRVDEHDVCWCCGKLCACDQAFKTPQRHQKLSSMISPAERFNERERATNAPGIGIAYVLCTSMMVLMVSLPP